MNIPTIDQIERAFDGIGDEYVHQITLITVLKDQGFDDDAVIRGLKGAIEANIFEVDAHGGVCKKIV